MSDIRVQLVEFAYGRAGFASRQARAEELATGNRNSIFNVFFTTLRLEAKCEISAPDAASRVSQSQKILEKASKSPIFRAVKL